MNPRKRLARWVARHFCLFTLCSLSITIMTKSNSDNNDNKYYLIIMVKDPNF